MGGLGSVVSVQLASMGVGHIRGSILKSEVTILEGVESKEKAAELRKSLLQL